MLLAYLQLDYHPDVADQPEITGERIIGFLAGNSDKAFRRDEIADET